MTGSWWLRRALALLALLSACAGGERTPHSDTELMVFAAASLRDVMLDQAAELERRGGPALAFNFAGSNVLALQLEASPRSADVFLSADRLWIDHLDRRGLLLPGSTTPFLSNKLVIVAARTSPIAVGELAELTSPAIRYLAVGHPEAVPAGRYARTLLESVRVDGVPLWERVKPRLAPASDARAALALVEARDDTVGIVYRTDARSTDRVRVLLEVPDSLAPPIGYFAAVAGESTRREAATRLVRYLGSDEARVIFERHGFSRAAGVSNG